jgi:hypothetical protein
MSVTELAHHYVTYGKDKRCIDLSWWSLLLKLEHKKSVKPQF